MHFYDPTFDRMKNISGHFKRTMGTAWELLVFQLVIVRIAVVFHAKNLFDCWEIMLANRDMSWRKYCYFTTHLEPNIITYSLTKVHVK